MEEHTHSLRRILREPLVDFVQGLFSLDGISSVDIEKHRFRPGVLDFTNHMMHRGHRRLTIQVNAKYVHSMPGKLDCSRSTKTTGSSQDYSPLIWLKPSLGFHKHLLQGVFTGVLKIARNRGKSKPIPRSRSWRDFSVGQHLLPGQPRYGMQA